MPLRSGAAVKRAGFAAIVPWLSHHAAHAPSLSHAAIAPVFSRMA